MDKLFSKLISVYEDFEPTTKWVQDVDHDTLLVYLPDFRRNQLKLLASSTEKLRIIGERPLGNNKWRRFKTELPISSNYDSDQITAKFENGVLHVKHPKKSISTTVTHVKPQETASQELPETLTEPHQKPADEAFQAPKSEENRTLKVPEEYPQKNSNDKKCRDNVEVEPEPGPGPVTNTGEVRESEIRCQYRQVFWVSIKEMIKKSRKPTHLVVFVMSLLVLLIAVLCVKNCN